MSYGDHDRRIGPLQIIAALIALGAVGGRRGQRALGRLKRVSGWAAVLSVPLAVLLGLALPHEGAALAESLTLVWGLIALAFWCYVAFAKWFTREDEDGKTD